MNLGLRLPHASSVSVPACVCVHTVIPQEGQHVGSSKGQHCPPDVAPLPGLSGFFQKDECHGLKNESSISKAIKDLAKMVNQRAHWFKTGRRALTTFFLGAPNSCSG